MSCFIKQEATVSASTFLSSEKAKLQFGAVEVTHSWWFIQFAILLSVFSNLMAIGLIRPAPLVKFPFQTSDELAIKLLDKTCKLIFLKGYNSTDFVKMFRPQGEKGGLFWKALLHVMETNSYLIAENLNEMAHRILRTTPQKCFVGLHYEDAKALFETIHCRLRLFPIDIEQTSDMTVYYHTVENLNELLAKVMTTDAIIAYNEYAKIKYYRSKNFPPCDIPEEAIPWTPITLKKVIWSYLGVLSFGFGLAFTSFLCEHFLLSFGLPWDCGILK